MTALHLSVAVPGPVAFGAAGACQGDSLSQTGVYSLVAAMTDRMPNS